MDKHELERAGIEAEYLTGEREGTEAAAKRHVVVRVARMTFGFAIVLVGIVMLPLPGPGAPIIAVGLVILAEDVAWADRALRLLRRKMPGMPEEGPIPRSTLLVGGLLSAAAAIAALWWFLA